jgi:predicted aspartyl protease
MGTVYEEITLKNAMDVGDAESGFIKEAEIRETAVRAIADTGAITLVINEGIREKLGLKIQGERVVTFANDTKGICKVTGPVEVLWKDRSFICQAMVASDKGEVLLGAIPLEGLDLMVNPVDQKLVGVHGDKVNYMIY